MSTSTPFTAEVKARVVLDILTGAKCAAEISAEHEIPESVLEEWRQAFIDRAPMVFEEKPKQRIKPGEIPSKPGEYEERGPKREKTDSDAAFNTSLERSIKDNADVWVELAKY